MLNRSTNPASWKKPTVFSQTFSLRCNFCDLQSVHRKSLFNNLSYQGSTSFRCFVGEAGFEPTASWSQTMRATNCATLRDKLVPREGVEPSRPCEHRILSPARLPFRHHGSLNSLAPMVHFKLFGS